MNGLNATFLIASPLVESESRIISAVSSIAMEVSTPVYWIGFFQTSLAALIE